MKIVCVLGEHNYGQPERGEGYEYVNFLPALRNLGHQVIFFESFSRTAYQDFGELNRKLLQTVEAEKPDVILCVLLTYEIWLETLELLRQGCNAVLINWSTDDSWKYEQFSRFVAPAFHLYATTYPDAEKKARQHGMGNFVLTQWAASSNRLAPPKPAAECRYPVSFIGSAYGNRPRWMVELASRGIAVECFGYGWNNGPVAAEEIPRIMRDSVISLNFADAATGLAGAPRHGGRQIKARVFEVPGAGGMLLTEQADNLDQFYHPGKELVAFDGVDDLADKIRHLLAQPDERDRIARAGHERTMREHTYEHRFRALLALADIQRTHLPVQAGQIDFARFDELQRAHRPGIMLKMLKWLLQFPCVMVWGRVRGPRAARRLLFELSWRLVGRKTYTASGWPGRLFYRES